MLRKKSLFASHPRIRVDLPNGIYKCSKCGHKDSRDFQHCPKCATKPEVCSCLECGHEDHRDFRHCPKCASNRLVGIGLYTEKGRKALSQAMVEPFRKKMRKCLNESS